MFDEQDEVAVVVQVLTEVTEYVRLTAAAPGRGAVEVSGRGRRGGDSDALCDRLLQLVSGHAEDDIVVLTVDSRPPV